MRFASRHPSATVIKLVRDYRSTPQIVDVANKILDAAGPSGLPGRVTLRSQREAGPAPVYREYSDEVAEADAVARAIARLRDEGVALRDIAVLFRTNAQSENFEQALAERKIPTVLKGAERFFERAEIRQAAVLLRGQAKAGDVSDDLVEVVTGVLAGAGWTPEPPTGTGAVRDRWESLSALVTMTSDFAAANPSARLADLMAELDRRASIQHAPLAEGVTLATLHAAKGLEWDCVFIVGRARGDAADQLRPDAGAGGGGAAAVLCRRDAGEAAALRQLVDLTLARAAAVSAVRPASSTRSACVRRAPSGAVIRRLGARRPPRPAVQPRPDGRSPSAGSAAAACSTPAPASSAAARTARPRSTRSCTTP